MKNTLTILLLCIANAIYAQQENIGKLSPAEERQVQQKIEMPTVISETKNNDSIATATQAKPIPSSQVTAMRKPKLFKRKKRKIISNKS